MTMVWVVSRFRLKVPPGSSSPYISPLIPSGQRNCASWASQPQKSVTLPPQSGGGTTKVRTNMWWHEKKKKLYWYIMVPQVALESKQAFLEAKCSLD